MFNTNPYGGYFPPSQPIVFIPSPGSSNPESRLQTITEQIAELEALKKVLKEEKKDEKKDDKKKDEGGDLRVINLALLMLLLSPITGPMMSKFFAWGLSLLPNVPH